MACSCTPTTTCNQCSSNEGYQTCLGKQIEQLTNRTAQLKAYIECLNPYDAFDLLCPVQSCLAPNCANTGTMCDNASPTGAPVGGGSDPSCCGQDNPANLTDFCDDTANTVRELVKLVNKMDKQICEIRSTALRTVLLDNLGNARGGLALNGDLKNFTVGSWEQVTG